MVIYMYLMTNIIHLQGLNLFFSFWFESFPHVYFGIKSFNFINYNYNIRILLLKKVNTYTNPTKCKIKCHCHIQAFYQQCYPWILCKYIEVRIPKANSLCVTIKQKFILFFFFLQNTCILIALETIVWVGQDHYVLYNQNLKLKPLIKLK